MPAPRPLHILVTGFGPFPGAPDNPTGKLVQTLADGPLSQTHDAVVTAHVFTTRYDTVDRTLPQLLADLRPDALLMFGLAIRSRAIRIECRARNTISATPDEGGFSPGPSPIDETASPSLAVRAPVEHLLAALQRDGLPARLSRDAGAYLCNYSLWHATRAAAQPDGPRIAAFIHVPPVSARMPAERMLGAGHTLLRATVAALRDNQGVGRT
ncbi:pyroglutamyl-peptidase I [Pseudorhodoplanes sp.]|uniref:pyroglutamyl-peptidase I family protein n=1 Tax=Pseudorhodoplanes sp. TaxID=1934341 RepID=UPI00391C5556